jgi:hypothetical protein
MVAAIAQYRSLPPENVSQRITGSNWQQQSESVIAGIDRVIRIRTAPRAERFTSQRSGLI